MIPDGAKLMIGGFMGIGTPERLIDEIVRQGKRDLTLIVNDTARRGLGVGELRRCWARRPDDLMTIGLDPGAQQADHPGTLAVDLVPQGTFVERVPAGGCSRTGNFVLRRHQRSVRKANKRLRWMGKPIFWKPHCVPICP